MNGIIIAIALYLIVGLILFYGQDKWVRKNDSEFYEELEFGDWLKYFFFSVVLWLPALIEYWFFLKDHEDKNKND
jgi:TM2 domain-containing membrane protein YozV